MADSNDMRTLAEAASTAALEQPGGEKKPMLAAVRQRAQAIAEKRASSGDESVQQLGPGVTRFVECLASDARTADVDDLLADGNDEDEALEIAINSALGASRARLENGLRALDEADS